MRAFSNEIRVLRGFRRVFSKADLAKTAQAPNVPQFHSSIQFSKDRLTEFGELPRGQVPHALNFSPANTHTRLSNGVQVFTEAYGGDFATVSVFIKAGSRFETIETSGASHFLTYMLAKGSKLRNRKEFQESLDAMGAHVEITTGREIVGFTLKVSSSEVGAAIELLAEAISQPDFNQNQIEADKELVHRRILDVSRDQFEYMKEAVFYTSFRDHMVGQSEYGIRDNISSLTAQQLEDFHRQNFVGNNTIFVVSGNFDSSLVWDSAQKHSQGLPAEAKGGQANLDKPILTPVVMSQRDDEMYNLNCGSGFAAPAFGDKDYFALKYAEKIIGDYNAEIHGPAHLNSHQLTRSTNHTLWGAKTGVNLAHTKYEAFSDFGLFTMYVHGNDFWGREIFFGMNFVASYLARSLEITEVFRARAEWFNELLSQHSSKKLNEDIAKELLYIGRRITRTEAAYRLSHLADPSDLRTVFHNYFFNKEIGSALWGPQHNIVQYNYYSRKLHQSTKGWTDLMC